MVPTVDRRDASTVSRKSLKKSRKKYLLRANRAPADAPGTLPVARASAFLLHHAYHFRFGSRAALKMACQPRTVYPPQTDEWRLGVRPAFFASVLSQNSACTMRRPPPYAPRPAAWPLPRHCLPVAGEPSANIRPACRTDSHGAARRTVAFSRRELRQLHVGGQSRKRRVVAPFAFFGSLLFESEQTAGYFLSRANDFRPCRTGMPIADLAL